MGLESNTAGWPDDLEKREEERFVLLLRPAKIVARSGEYLCILRDVASKGVRLRLFHPLPPDPFMVLELANGDRYEIEKVWERDEQAGFNFVHRAELQHLLEERSRFRKRPVRLRLEMEAKVTVGAESFASVLCNLSQKGGQIEADMPLAIDQSIRVEAKGLPPLVAKVRWRRGRHVGLVFEQTFKLDDLARKVALLQPFGPAIPDEDPVFARLKAG